MEVEDVELADAEAEDDPFPVDVAVELAEDEALELKDNTRACSVPIASVVVDEDPRVTCTSALACP